MNNLFEARIWESLPDHFWSVVAFVLGAMTGSFLNVCIHRMPRNASVIRPPSSCPHCRERIPWRHNVPLVSFCLLRGRCARCAHPISLRYPGIEALTALAFLSCWLVHRDLVPAGSMALLLSLLIVATFIDMEHFIIPDRITLGGMVLGLSLSLLFPGLHDAEDRTSSFLRWFGGAATGAGLVYLIIRVGKLCFGWRREQFGEDVPVVFGENSLFLPDEEIPYGDIFYRRTDQVVLQARKVELIGECIPNAEVRLSQDRLRIGQREHAPEEVAWMEATTDRILMSREVMGLGDVKFMGAIGAFLGWQAVLFSLMISSLVGSLIGVLLIVSGRQDWSSRIPYGPYISLAAAIWIFLPGAVREQWNENVDLFLRLVAPGIFGGS